MLYVLKFVTPWPRNKGFPYFYPVCLQKGMRKPDLRACSEHLEAAILEQLCPLHKGSFPLYPNWA